ncbi:MAG: hypothetical protein ACK55I_40590 [bacterium]
MLPPRPADPECRRGAPAARLERTGATAAIAASSARSGLCDRSLGGLGIPRRRPRSGA